MGEPRQPPKPRVATDDALRMLATAWDYLQDSYSYSYGVDGLVYQYQNRSRGPTTELSTRELAVIQDQQVNGILQLAFGDRPRDAPSILAELEQSDDPNPEFYYLTGPLVVWLWETGTALAGEQLFESYNAAIETSCPLCGAHAELELDSEHRFLIACSCRTTSCEGWWWCSFLSPDENRALARFAQLQYRRNGETPRLRATDVAASLLALPKTMTQIHDEFLLMLGAEARRKNSVGEYHQITNMDIPLVLGSSTGDLAFHMKYLGDRGLVKALSEDWSGPPFDLRLKVAGWQRVEDLEQGVVEKPRQAFVAMWFAKESRAAYLDGIEPAITDAGYDAMQLGFEEHNDDINDRIIAEIRKSRFVVADFTGNRGGVYFEAGFALGLGKPVIWTCRRDFFEGEGVHFDTQARNHILWDTPADLRTKLRDRIEATIANPER